MGGCCTFPGRDPKVQRCLPAWHPLSRTRHREGSERGQPSRAQEEWGMWWGEAMSYFSQNSLNRVSLLPSGPDGCKISAQCSQNQESGWGRQGWGCSSWAVGPCLVRTSPVFPARKESRVLARGCQPLGFYEAIRRSFFYRKDSER